MIILTYLSCGGSLVQRVQGRVNPPVCALCWCFLSFFFFFSFFLFFFFFNHETGCFTSSPSGSGCLHLSDRERTFTGAEESMGAVWDRETLRDTERVRETRGGRQKQRERVRERGRNRERGWEREGDGGRGKERERGRGREAERERGREREKVRDRLRERESRGGVSSEGNNKLTDCREERKT